MRLSSGANLGPYEILAPIGAGGMGEVYKARDTRLNRIVAIKTSGEQFGERFDREARAVAALNHPNICQLYDVGPDHLVMEFVDGAPLKGPLPLARSLDYAGQILDALDAAHRKGITHRDLKPGNIMVTRQGTIKLLDFGLAKQCGPAFEGVDNSTATITGKGEIVGTLQYMSPEQLQGKQVDARSDLFSFGCVLYEMLTGERAFEGQNAASVIAAILEREPAPLMQPPALERVVRRCLAKDPDQRFQTARDLKAALNWSAAGNPVPTIRRSVTPWLVAGAFGLVAGAFAVLAVWAPWTGKRPVARTPQPLVRLEVDLGSDVSLGPGADVILSPDGTRLVYVSQSKLFTRKLDQSTATELPGTDGAFAPFFKPDGEWVAFFAQGKLKKVPVQGGAVMTLCDASATAVGGSWGTDDNIVAALSAVGGLHRLSGTGGSLVRLTEIDRERGEQGHRWPQILPGGKAVLFGAHSALIGGFDGVSIEALSLADGRRRAIRRGGTFPRYLPSGHLTYFNRGAVFAVPFDVDRLEALGTPEPVLRDVRYDGSWGAAQFDFFGTPTDSGTLAYGNGGAGDGLFTLQWLDAAGKTQPLLPKPGEYYHPKLSPDGERMALVFAGKIFIYDLRRETLTLLAAGSNPQWSPDGRYVVFNSPAGMSCIRWEGEGEPQTLTKSHNRQMPWSFTPDGKRLAYVEIDTETRYYQIWTVPVANDGVSLRAGKPEALLKTRSGSDERHPEFSPDGRWLAYTSYAEGAQVLVRAFPDRGVKWQISNAGGLYPAWSRDGAKLMFRSLDNLLMVVDYRVMGDSFVAGKPKAWSGTRLVNVGNIRNYDLARDGKRVVAIMPSETPDGQKSRHHVVFLLNFYDELRRRMPVPDKH